MKKKLITVVLLNSILSGCGGSDSGSSASGITYDIKDFFPQQNVTNNYEVYKKYSLSNSDYTFGSEFSADYEVNVSGYQKNYTQNYKDISSQIGTFSNDNLTVISTTFYGTTQTSTTTRKFQVGNVLSNSTDKSGSSSTCIAEDILPTKEFVINSNTYVFNDVLKVKCTFISDSSIDVTYDYFAKGKGQVAFEDRQCTDESGKKNDNSENCILASEKLEILVSQK